MKRTFEEVRRSIINHSPTKEAHAFNNSPRFTPQKPPLCPIASYDLTHLTISSQFQKKRLTLPHQVRFRSTSRSISPSPCDYVKNQPWKKQKPIKVGPTLNRAERSFFLAEHRIIPGPGTYSPHSASEHTRSVSISPRIQYPKIVPSVGPGDYQTENYDGLVSKINNKIYSKYSSIPFHQIGKQQRFTDTTKAQVTPGPGQYSDVRRKTSSNKFGGQKRKSYFQSNSITPGPGKYEDFSEFAERRRELNSKLQHMSSLVSRRGAAK